MLRRFLPHLSRMQSGIGAVLHGCNDLDLQRARQGGKTRRTGVTPTRSSSTKTTRFACRTIFPWMHRATALRGNHALLAAATLEGRAGEEGRDRRPGRTRSHGREIGARHGSGSHRAQPVAEEAGRRQAPRRGPFLCDVRSGDFYETGEAVRSGSSIRSRPRLIGGVSEPAEGRMEPWSSSGLPEKDIPIGAFSLRGRRASPDRRSAASRRRRRCSTSAASTALLATSR